MMASDIDESLCGLLAQRFAVPAQTLGPGHRLVEDLEIDSLEMADLLLDIEDRFGVVLGSSVVLSLQTVGDVQKAVRESVQARI